MKNTILGLIILALIQTFAPAPCAGQTPNPPGQFSYQGFLTDANGLPLATNNPINYTVIFRIYNGATSGNLLWAEQQVVTVDRGYFTVMLGNGTSVPGANNSSDLTSLFAGTNTVPSDASDRYLELTVTDLGSTPIAPRLRLLPSPYAYLAATAVNALSVSAAGHVPDTSLSTNIALRAGGNTFSGNQGILGNVGIGTPTPAAPLDVTGTATGVAAGASIDPSVFVRVYNGAADGNVTSPDVAGIAFGHNSTRQAIVGGTYGNDFLDFYTGGTLTAPRMRIDYSGNVGIGTNAPAATLDVNGSGLFHGPVVFAGAGINNAVLFEGLVLFNNTPVFEGTALFNGNAFFNSATALSAHNTLQFGQGLAGQEPNAGKIGYEVFTPDSLDIVGAGTNGPSRKIKFWAEGGANFNGNVGIGTSTPGVPLDVSGSTVISCAQYGFLNNTTPTAIGAGATLPTSIRASARVVAAEFDAVSDRRIKDIIGQSDSQADLETIQKLRVTDYRMKDRVANGDAPLKGFIAQEVEAVIPEAVTRSRQFVPDIYAAASGAKFDAAAKTVAVKLAKAHGLKTGDRVRLMTEAEQMDLTVSSVRSEQEFVAANCEREPKQVFVFGKEVNDFRTLNYDRIFTTGISAMQELARRVSALEAKEADRVALEKRAARVDALERELADLKAVVGRLADRKDHQASARGVSGQEATSDQSRTLVAEDNAGGATRGHSTSQPNEQ